MSRLAPARNPSGPALSVHAIPGLDSALLSSERGLPLIPRSHHMTSHTGMGGKGPVFFAFFVVWAILGISSFLFFHLNRDAKTKKKIFPFFVIGVGIIFSTFVAWSSDWAPFVLFFFIPAVGLITFLNLRTTKFCESCGRTLYKQSLLDPPRFCPHCGNQLEAGPKEPNQP